MVEIVSLVVPDLAELTARVVDDWRARASDDDLSRHKGNYKLASMRAAAAWQIMHAVKTAESGLMADTAAGDDLDRLGATYGVTRKGATPARKANALRVTGTAASTVAIGDQLTSAGGLTFQVNENATIPAAGFVDVDVIGVSVGSATRLQTGEVLTFTAAPAGINDEAELQLDLDEDGEDQESQGAYRTRILDQIQQPGMGGNANDYRRWALEVDGIASAYPYPIRRGLGTVDVAALHVGRGSVRLLTTQERDDLKAYIDDVRPVAMLAFRVIEVTALATNVEVTVDGLPGYGWDWDDTGGSLEVASWEPGGAERTLRLTADRPADIKVGSRIIIKDAAGVGTGEQFAVEDLPATLTDLVLAKAPATSPVSPDEVHAGGDLVDPVRDGILAFMDGLGPAIGSAGLGDWIDELEPEHLLAIALQTTGVRTGVTVAPSATVTPDDPAWPLDTTVELITPQRVIVRRKV